MTDKKGLKVKLWDGFLNVIKGLGTSKDSRQHTVYQKGLYITQQIANDLYVYNWLARKVVDAPIDDATRKWRNLLIPDADEKKEIEDLLDEYNVKYYVGTAMKWTRVFGGAVIMAIIDGQDQEEPLEIEKIRPGSLKKFIVLDRYNIYADVINRNILSDNYGQPEYYTVSRGGQRVHHSRLFKFTGDTSTIMELELQNFWGNSIFTAGWEAISDSQTVSQSISNLVFEASVDVYRINGLNALIAEGNDDLVTKRLKIAHEMKSVINGIALDKEDEYDKKTAQFSQLPLIDDRFIQKVSGAYNIPVTRLVGISPAGMNSTGESDMNNYYDEVQSLQENDMRPAINWMDKIILASADVKTKDFKYEFKPLKQLTETEQADVDLKKAQRDQVYLDYDVVDKIDVMSELAENGTYVSVDENKVEEEKKAYELELEQEELETEEPVIPPEGEEVIEEGEIIEE